MSISTEGWRHRLVAYEDALASFREMQDCTRHTLEQSGEIIRSMFRLVAVKMEPNYFAFTFATVDP